MLSKEDDKKENLASHIRHKQKGEEKFDKNLRISQIHHKKKENLASHIRHKQKGEEKFDKNLRISQIHHKKKEILDIIKNEINISRILCTIFIFVTILGLSLVTISSAESLNYTENISQLNINGQEELSSADIIEQTDKEAGPLPQTDEAIISSGTIYYVAKNGNDNNPGTGTQPWLTIRKAADTATAGSTVYIKTGTYKEKLIPKYSGSSGNYITFAAYPGNSVTIDGTGIAVSSWSGLVLISGKSYINITGLRIINSGWAGIFVSSSHHINLKKNYIYKTTSSGILMTFGNNYIVDGNEIVLGNNDRTDQEILSIQSSVNIFEIKNNYLHDGKGIGIDAKNGASNGKIHHNKVYKVGSIGIYADAWDKIQSNIQIYSNRVYNSGTGIGLAGEIGGILNNVTIFNNLIYDNPGIGIRIPVTNNYGNSHLNNIKVSNNVVYRNGYSGQGGIAIGLSTQAYIYNLIVKNNVISQNDYYQIKHIPNSKHSNIVVDRNLIDGYRGIAYEVRGTNYIEGNPLFNDVSVRDFHLKTSSPAIDRGSSSYAPNIDFDGISRPKGVAYDIGSYECTKIAIMVTSPNGGENWRRSTIRTISWSSTGSSGSYVKIELFKNGVLNRIISSSTPNDGSYSWSIPSTQTLGSDFKLKITSTSNSAYTDTSNSNFVISQSTYITVVSPNGGESWKRSTTHTISWNYGGSPGSYVKIELFKNGALNRVIISSTSNDGSYSWTIPSTQTLGTDYKVKISSISNSIYTDTSNSNLIISS